jgi:hypothetical protein
MRRLILGLTALSGLALAVPAEAAISLPNGALVASPTAESNHAAPLVQKVWWDRWHHWHHHHHRHHHWHHDYPR